MIPASRLDPRSAGKPLPDRQSDGSTRLALRPDIGSYYRAWNLVAPVVVSYGPRRFGSRMPAVPEVVESKEPWARLNSNANQQDADDPEVGPGQYGWKCAPHQHKRNGIHRGIRSVVQPSTLRGTDLSRNCLPQAVAPLASESTDGRGPFIQIPPPLSGRRWQKSLGSSHHQVKVCRWSAVAFGVDLPQTAARLTSLSGLVELLKQLLEPLDEFEERNTEDSADLAQLQQVQATCAGFIIADEGLGFSQCPSGMCPVSVALLLHQVWTWRLVFGGEGSHSDWCRFPYAW